jgi:tetratricopeptide (TPR) repeat protein
VISSRTFCFSAFLLLGLGLGPLPSFAQDTATAQARQLFEDAQKQFDLGNWDAAVVGFSKAYELRPDPTFLYNMAQAYRRAGNNRRAIDLYKNYLIKAPKSPQRAEVEEKIKALQRQLDAEEKEAKRTVATQPSAPTTAAPAPMVEATAGEPSVGGTSDVSPAPEAESLAPPPPAATAEAPVEGQPLPDFATSPANPTSGSRKLRVAGVIVASAGGAALLAGLLYSARVQQLSDQITKAPQYNDVDAQEAKRDQKAQWVCYGAGALFVATGAYLYWRGRPSKQQEVSVAVAPWLAGNGGGLFASGSFQ